MRYYLNNDTLQMPNYIKICNNLHRTYVYLIFYTSFHILSFKKLHYLLLKNIFPFGDYEALNFLIACH
jgi:hypothetical protein